MPIDDEGLTAVTSLVRDSFRVHEDDDIVYVDIQGRLNRVASAQHQVIFGRRGSGKSSLLVSLHQQAPELGLLSIYLNADRYKKLSYPDMLIRLLLSLLSRYPVRNQGSWDVLRKACICGGRLHFSRLSRSFGCCSTKPRMSK